MREGLCKIIAITGGSGSGKSTLAALLSQGISEARGPDHVAVLTTDDYYLDQSHRFVEDGGRVNFDHPSSLDFDLLEAHLRELKRGRSIQVPRYDLRSHRRLRETAILHPKEIVLVDGVLILSNERLRPYFDVSIFVDTPEPIRFDRRLKRDVLERGREPAGVRRQFLNQVKPMHDLYVEPSKEHATIVISGDDDHPPFAASIERLISTSILS